MLERYALTIPEFFPLTFLCVCLHVCEDQQKRVNKRNVCNYFIITRENGNFSFISESVQKPTLLFINFNLINKILMIIFFYSEMRRLSTSLIAYFINLVNDVD